MSWGAVILHCGPCCTLPERPLSHQLVISADAENNEPPTGAESLLRALRMICLPEMELVCSIELAARTPTSPSSTGRCGSEIISETSRCARGRSWLMAAPQWRPNYSCPLSLHHIIYSSAGPAEACGRLLQDLTTAAKCLIWGDKWQATNKQIWQRWTHRGWNAKTWDQWQTLPVYCSSQEQSATRAHTHNDTNHRLCSVTHEGCFSVIWFPLGENVTMRKRTD